MLTFHVFAAQITDSPLLAVSMVLVLGSIFINGSTDAANSIAEAVGTRSISFGRAIVMALICESAGLIGSVLVTTAVADTIGNMVDFGGDSHHALVALSAAMVAIVVWGGVAWAFGIPTSESHALIAGLSGAAVALQGGIDGINFSEWAKVLWGLVLSTFGGCILGYALCRLICHLCADANYREINEFFAKLQVVGAGFGSFMHGAQDGQKFLSTAMLAITLAEGGNVHAQTEYPLWLMATCSLVLAAGVAVGGRKIVKTVGTKVVQMEKYQGAAASLSSGFSLLASSIFGLPVSTTHTKTAAILGAGASRSVKSVNWGIALDMARTWILTFPGCGLIGYVLAWVFLRLW